MEYYSASVNLDNVDVLYLEDGNLPVLKNKPATMFFLKKPIYFHLEIIGEMTSEHVSY